MDVVDGRLRCNYEQAIVLASYSLQAEFGDHDTEKHTLEYLQDFPLLPKPMMAQLTEDRLGKMPKFERNRLLWQQGDENEGGGGWSEQGSLDTPFVGPNNKL